jgi:hypothetical protein
VKTDSLLNHRVYIEVFENSEAASLRAAIRGNVPFPGFVTTRDFGRDLPVCLLGKSI